LGLHFGIQNKAAFSCFPDRSRDFTVHIGQVAKNQGSAITGSNTRRLMTLVDQVLAQGTLLGNLLITINADNIIWTGFYACFTPRTHFFVYENKAIGPLVDGLSRTGFNTGWVSAMHTKFGQIIHR